MHLLHVLPEELDVVACVEEYALALKFDQRGIAPVLV
jgi:hypothetical protein